MQPKYTYITNGVKNIQIMQWTIDVTITSIDAFQHALMEFLDDRYHCLVLDLENIQYMTSTGLSILVDIVMSCKAREKEIIISGIKDPFRVNPHFTKLGMLIKFFASQQEALDYFINGQGNRYSRLRKVT